MVEFKKILFEFFVKNLLLAMIIILIAVTWMPQFTWEYEFLGSQGSFQPFGFMRSTPWIASVILATSFMSYVILSMIFAIFWIEILRLIDKLGILDEFYIKVLKIDKDKLIKYKAMLHGIQTFKTIVPLKKFTKIKVPKIRTSRDAKTEETLARREARARSLARAKKLRSSGRMVG